MPHKNKRELPELRVGDDFETEKDIGVDKMDYLEMHDTIRKTIVKRAYRLKFMNIYKILDGKPFILAGGALGKDYPNDFDIYPIMGYGGFTADSIINKIVEISGLMKVEILFNSKNAVTLNVEGQTVQFCNYRKDDLKSLIKSFDYAHCQVGVLFGGNDEPPHEDGVEFTNEFISSMVCENTFYTGSEYPTASLIRTIKYAKRGKFNGKEYVSSILMILNDIINRGFTDYDDFKDQMDAIDLGLSGYEKAFELFKTSEERGLVYEKRTK